MNMGTNVSNMSNMSKISDARSIDIDMSNSNSNSYIEEYIFQGANNYASDGVNANGSGGSASGSVNTLNINSVNGKNMGMYSTGTHIFNNDHNDKVFYG